VDEARYHMTVLKVEVVVGTKDVSGNDTREHAAILFMVGSVLDVNQSLGVRISIV
jgi:hypothetical protein